MPDRWSLFRGLLGPWARHAARRVIVGRQRSAEPASERFARSDVDRIVSRAGVGSADLLRDLDSQTLVGSRSNVRLACLTLAFFRALTEYGVDRTYAIELTADLSRSSNGKWAFGRFVEIGDVFRGFSVLSVGDVMPPSFPFNPPGRAGLPSLTPEARLECDDRHASRWTSVRSSR